MPNKSHGGDHGVTATAGEPSAPEAAEIRRQLDRVLASSHLCQSRRCQALLRHVIDAYLEGCLEKVKERCIGFEVFQRDADYDTSRDSIVRTTAAEVRKRLAQYYLEPEHEHELRIVLPPGSYSPEFRPGVPFAAAVVTAPPPKRLPRWTPWAGAIVVVAAAIGASLLSRGNEMDLFWKPFLQDRSEAVICIEQPLRIFRFMGPRREELNGKMVGDEHSPAATQEVRNETSIKLSEIEPTGSAYFSFGDLIATTRISELFARKGKTFQILGDRLAAYHELRGRPVVLLGQFNNQWTQGLTSGLRYYLEKDRQQYEIRDRQHPDKIVAFVPRERRDQDLAIVSRIFDVSTEKTVVAVSASTYLGTLAAGDFLTQASYMRQAFASAPSGWYRKNIQVVLKAPMVRGTAGPPQAIATYFW
jgi:hypothetical protein